MYKYDRKGTKTHDLNVQVWREENKNSGAQVDEQPIGSAMANEVTTLVHYALYELLTVIWLY